MERGNAKDRPAREQGQSHVHRTSLAKTHQKENENRQVPSRVVDDDGRGLAVPGAPILEPPATL